MNTTFTEVVRASVSLVGETVRAEIHDGRPESALLFGGGSSEHQRQLAVDAWSIGLRALENAHAQAREARLEDIGQTLVRDVDRQLQLHVDSQQRTLATILAKYFDPGDGQVTERLRAFVDDQGVLAGLLNRYLGPQNSVLADTLARQVGDQSELFKMLSPTETDGLVKVIERQLQTVMDQNRTSLVTALDPLAEDGAVARFLRSLREELKSAKEDNANQLSTAVAALDANDENSLISRLVRETAEARRAVLHAVNPDAENSPMASLKASLTSMLKGHAETHEELLRRQSERHELLDREIREALARLETKRSHDQRSPQGGHDFEESVVRFLAAAVDGAPCVIDATGSTSGARPRCKVGDAVVRFTSESAFMGAAVVFEAKRDASYTTNKALEELDIARSNRGAQAGVFVMATTHAQATFPRFARHGSNVLVTWDENDPATDSYLHAAVMLGLALVARVDRPADAGDIDALQDVEARIEQELERYDKLNGFNDGIRRNSEKIGEELRRGRGKLDLLLRKAKDTLRALNVELSEEGVERGSPIAAPQRSFERAQATRDAADLVDE